MRSVPWTMSADVARRIALGAQGFCDRAPKGAVDRRHLRRAMGRMRVLQLDSIPVVIRTQYLPFHARLGPYQTALLDRVAYRDDEWFEAWAHEASLLPVASEPWFRWMKARSREGQTWKWLHTFATRESAYVRDVLGEVRARGVVSASELSDPRPRQARGGWGTRSQGAMALDWLFRVGEVGIRRRGNFEKRFSPLCDIVPESIRRVPTPSMDDAVRMLSLESVRALGVGTANDIADYFRLPIRNVRLALAELAEQELIVPADVESWERPAFADPQAVIPRNAGRTTVLSPFDPLVWRRDRVQRLFDFEYKIEIYVPAAKRRWGYYVLPVLVDGHLVARVDVKTDREHGVLRIKAAHAERGRCDASSVPRIAKAIVDLARLVGAGDIDVERRGDLASRLRKAVRAGT